MLCCPQMCLSLIALVHSGVSVSNWLNLACLSESVHQMNLKPRLSCCFMSVSTFCSGCHCLHTRIPLLRQSCCLFSLSSSVVSQLPAPLCTPPSLTPLRASKQAVMQLPLSQYNEILEVPKLKDAIFYSCQLTGVVVFWGGGVWGGVLLIPAPLKATQEKRDGGRSSLRDAFKVFSFFLSLLFPFGHLCSLDVSAFYFTRFLFLF